MWITVESRAVMRIFSPQPILWRTTTYPQVVAPSCVRKFFPQKKNAHSTSPVHKFFAPNCPPARSALGSTSGGAGSPNGLTEGVSSVEWYYVGWCFVHPTALFRKQAVVRMGTRFVLTNRTPSASHSLSSSPKGGAEGASRHKIPTVFELPRHRAG